MDDTKLLMRRLAVIRRVAKVARHPGKTTIQKIIYFLQNEKGLPLGYRFKMHYYGPYSEKLDGNLSLANAMGLVKIVPDAGGYGYHVNLGPQEVENYESSTEWDDIDGAITTLGKLELWRLELMATAHFVKKIHPHSNRNAIFALVRRLKPKFREEAVEDAITRVYGGGVL